MSRRQIRISMDEALWDAVQAVAQVRRIAPHLYVEEVLMASLGPSDAMQKAMELAESMRDHASELLSNSIETRDQIRIIADYIVDLYRARDEGEPLTNGL